MKSNFLKLLFATLMVLYGSLTVNAVPQYEDRSVAGSLTPEIRSFIGRYFHQSKVVSYEKEVGVDRFDIKLSDGYEIGIKSDGQLEKIKAPDGAVIPATIVRKFLPRVSYNYLADRNLEMKVRKISFDFNKGFEVDIAAPSVDMNFTKTGMTYK